MILERFGIGRSATAPKARGLKSVRASVVSRAKSVTGRGSNHLVCDGLFKGDGTRLENPGLFAKKLVRYEGGLYNVRGEEVADPVRYLAGMSPPPFSKVTPSDVAIAAEVVARRDFCDFYVVEV